MKKSLGLFGKKQIVFFVLPFIILILMLLLLPDLKKTVGLARKMNSLASSLKSNQNPSELKLGKTFLSKNEFETYIASLMLQGKDDKAIEIANKYQNSYPTKTQPYFRLGVLYLTKSYKAKVPLAQNLWKNKAIEEFTKGTNFLAEANFFEIWDYGRTFEKLELFKEALSCVL